MITPPYQISASREELVDGFALIQQALKRAEDEVERNRQIVSWLMGDYMIESGC